MASNTPMPELTGFVETIAALRAPDGCPWDRKQTHASIAKNMLEEAYEAVDAIEQGDVEHLREELGDVLLEVVLQAQIAADAGEFTLEDVAHDVNAKMIRRHPHVFGTQASFEAAGIDPASVEDADDVEKLWDLVKDKEREVKEAKRRQRMLEEGLDPDAPESIIGSVSTGQPALMQCLELSKKTVHVGFEWETTEDVWTKVSEEVEEFKAAEPRSDEAEMEFGDILFALVNVARREHINPEMALRKSCDKFRKRWEAMERMAAEGNQDIATVGTLELNRLWDAAKAGE